MASKENSLEQFLSLRRMFVTRSTGAASLHNVLLTVLSMAIHTHKYVKCFPFACVLIVCNFFSLLITLSVAKQMCKFQEQAPHSLLTWLSNCRRSDGVSRIAAGATRLLSIRWITRCGSWKVRTAGSPLGPWSIDLATLSTCASLHHHHHHHRLSEVLFFPA